MTNALVRARADLEAGRAWKARDRLTSVLVTRQDDEVLELLIQVHLQMGDLPKAGALLFVLGREDDVAQEAIAAWRQRFGDGDARWRSIPAPVRYSRADHLYALQDEGLAEGREPDLPPRRDVDPSDNSELAACLFAGLVGAVLLALVVIGLITVVRAVF
ncbi:DUF6584 family protein [Nocardioides sp. WS12]|uniref:DUF6584 family protein n=1 Tax=Nocardioides sp. WS12 TaxID=2486272 RepID=UPI0015F9CFD1|nr:DUF6584 family protein [Nocardioides sp. WS12]